MRLEPMRLAGSTRHSEYRLSQRVRKRFEEVFGWVKKVGGGLAFCGNRKMEVWYGGATC